MSRARDLDRFYEALARLQSKLGGCRCLGACGGGGSDGWRWPLQGVYFFFEGPSHAHHESKRGGKRGHARAMPLEAPGVESKSITFWLGNTMRRFAPTSDRNHPQSLIAFTSE